VRLLADAVGVPRDGVNYVAYSGGGQALAAVLGGHVSAGVSGIGEFAGQLESGDLRALAISAPERIPSRGASAVPSGDVDIASTIPTFRELGHDVVLMNWRGVVAPPGISRDARQSLERMIAALTASREWRDALARNGWTDLTLVGEPFGRFVLEETRRVAPLVAGGAAQRSDWFERLVLAALALAVAVAGVELVRQRTTSAVSASPPASNRTSLLMVVAAVALQAALLRPAGFVVASTTMFLLVARAFGSRRLPRDLAVGLAFALAVFLTFAHGLGIALPPGPFG
jgi:hypothetical protein